MSIDKDIAQFVTESGATEPSLYSEDFRKWKAIFKRSNYFIFNGKLMIVKISRSNKPFWGLTKGIIDLLNSMKDYLLVLLVSSREGWVFNKKDVNDNIRSNRWKLRVADQNYKINYPLPDSHSFISMKSFFKKVAVESEKNNKI